LLPSSISSLHKLPNSTANECITAQILLVWKDQLKTDPARVYYSIRFLFTSAGLNDFVRRFNQYQLDTIMTEILSSVYSPAATTNIVRVERIRQYIMSAEFNCKMCNSNAMDIWKSSSSLVAATTEYNKKSRTRYRAHVISNPLNRKQQKQGKQRKKQILTPPKYPYTIIYADSDRELEERYESFDINSLQFVVGGYSAVIHIKSKIEPKIEPKALVVHVDGGRYGEPVNVRASLLADRKIVGDVLYCNGHDICCWQWKEYLKNKIG
jgi:hypothetical protein